MAVNAEKLVSRLKGDSFNSTQVDYGDINISDAEVNGSFIIPYNFTSKHASGRTWIFTNCVFKDEVRIEHFGYVQTLKFENCIFRRQAKFKNIRNLFIITGETEFQGDVEFLFNQSNDSNYSSFSLSKAIFRNNVKIEGSLSSLKIFECNQAYKEDMSFGNVRSVVFENFECNSLVILKVSIDVLHFTSNIIIKDDFGIHGCELNHFSIQGLSVSDKTEFSDSRIGVLTFRAREKGLGLTLLQNLTITESVQFTLDHLVNTRFIDCNIESLFLSGTNLSGSYLSIENSAIKELYFKSVINLGSISLREIKSQTMLLAIQSSNLGKTDFILCDFSKAKLEFENTKMTEVFLSESDFPKEVYRQEHISHRQAQLIFGQLNTAYQKQGDTIRALEYQAREVESHFKDLKLRGVYNETRLNLCLNRLSNNFGRSWGQGVLFTVIVGFVFFYLVILVSPDYQFTLEFHTSIRMGIAFLKFLNPIRFFDAEALFQNNGKPLLQLSFGSYIFDFLGRVTVAYGIYQTIQAFRRYGRK